MECTDCGARNARNATFCVRCGAELVLVEDQVSASAVGEDTDRLDPVADDESAAMVVEEDAATATVPDDEADDRHIQDEEPESETDSDAADLLRGASELIAVGKADEAAARCREAIALAPDLVAAYSMLGMAEERRGNTVAAAGAYRRVLQLDPARRVEREKLEMLHASGASSVSDRDDEASDSPVIRYAPWVAAVGAAFLVLMLLTGVGWRMHLERQAEVAFYASMEIGQQSLDLGDYHGAMQAFEAALAVRSEDPDAQQGMRYARRKLMTASGSAVDPSAVMQPIPHSAQLLPPRGPNPFQPVPIGQTDREREREVADAPGAPSPEQPARQVAPRPPVVTPERVTGRQTPERARQQPAPSTAVPFGPLEEGEPSPASTGDADAQRVTEPETDVVDAAPEPKRRGEISIWVSEAPVEKREDRVEPSVPTVNTEHADRARELRSRASQARQQNNCERAVELYNQAIEAYRQDTRVNPGNRAANQAAIAACERARALCKPEGQ